MSHNDTKRIKLTQVDDTKREINIHDGRSVSDSKGKTDYSISHKFYVTVKVKKQLSGIHNILP